MSAAVRGTEPSPKPRFGDPAGTATPSAVPSPFASQKWGPPSGKILTAENVFDDGGFVSLGLFGLDISAAQRPEVVQHHMNSDIKWLTRGQRGLANAS